MKNMTRFLAFSTVLLFCNACIAEMEDVDSIPHDLIGYAVNVDYKNGDKLTRSGAGSEKSVNILQLDCEVNGKATYLHTITQDWGPEAPAVKGGMIDSDALANGQILVSAWVYDDEYAAGSLYFENEVVSAPWNTHRYWPYQNENIRFYGFAPAELSDVYGDMVWNDGVPSFDYKVPSEIAEQNDLLVAVEDVAYESYGLPVPMHFTHALTAVNIVMDDIPGFELSKITLSGVKDEGTYSDGQWSGDDATMGTYVLGASNQIMLLMPQNLDEAATITVEGTDVARNKEVSVSASIGGSGKSWKQGTKVTYRISITTTEVEYVLEIDGSDNPETSDDNVPYYGQIGRSFGVRSYKKIYHLGSDVPTLEPVPWMIRGGKTYNPDTGAADLDGEDMTSYWIDYISDLEGLGNATGYETGTYEVVAIETALGGTLSHARMRNMIQKGSESEPYDLSTVGGTEQQTTSNCYVVDAPGYYKLPLIYGNAITGGNIEYGSYYTESQNTQVSVTYTGYDTEGNLSSELISNVDVRVLMNFLNYKGGPIARVNILEDVGFTSDQTGCEVVWQDEPCLVTELHVEDNYLCFRIREDCVAEGNAVIAVTDPDGTIMWSWHIWVTDNDEVDSKEMFNRRVLQNEDGTVQYLTEKFDVLGTSIGFCRGEHKVYNQRKGKIWFCQIEDGELIQEKPLVIVQGANAVDHVYSTDNATYYQYGRKDPHFPAFKGQNKYVYRNSRNQVTEGYDGVRVGFVIWSEDRRGNNTIQEAIRNPGFMYCRWDLDYGENGVEFFHWINDPVQCHFFNLWNTHSNILPAFDYTSTMTPAEVFKQFEPLINIGVQKTIYDPSPRGYEMPRVDAFTGFTFNGLNYVDSDGTRTGINRTDTPFDNGYDFYLKPMRSEIWDGVSNAGSDFLRIKALGHKSDESGALGYYSDYGAALTSSPVCIRWSKDAADSRHKVQLLRFLYANSSQNFRTMSASHCSFAFPVIPVKTGSNPDPTYKKYYSDPQNVEY